MAYVSWHKLRYFVLQRRSLKSDSFIKLADAKARICLYGSSSVIRSFSKFEQLGATMNTNEQRNAFIKMATEMRKDVRLRTNLSAEDLSWVLLGKY
jgi:hypothetical protein